MSKKTALILSGGGARGAYQVGVLKGLAEILKKEEIENPFQILSGVSAGAINTAHLASHAGDFSTAVEKLIYLWSQIKSDQVFKVNLFSLNKFSFSQLLKMNGESLGNKFNSLLDTDPLRSLLLEHIDFSQIQKNVEKGKFESVIITANSYFHNAAVSFMAEHKEKSKKSWNDSRRMAQNTEINVDHVLASSAIPILFPPIQINKTDFGDGCVRNTTPCSPSLRMGAEKLFVIGVRSQKAFERGADLNILDNTEEHRVSMISLVNTLLNAVLLDSVEQDVQRIMRINELISQVQSVSSKKSGHLKEVPALCISPSINIGQLARQYAHKLPRLLRTSLSTFGSLDDAHEIISYLMFDADFCKKLISYGYDDALENKKEITNFFEK
jgi:NTE family protein